MQSAWRGHAARLRGLEHSNSVSRIQRQWREREARLLHEQQTEAAGCLQRLWRGRAARSRLRRRSLAAPQPQRPPHYPTPAPPPPPQFRRATCSLGCGNRTRDVCVTACLFQLKRMYHDIYEICHIRHLTRIIISREGELWSGRGRAGPGARDLVCPCASCEVRVVSCVCPGLFSVLYILECRFNPAYPASLCTPRSAPQPYTSPRHRRPLQPTNSSPRR